MIGIVGQGGGGAAGQGIFGFTTLTQNAGVGLEDLATYTLEGGTLSQDGDWLYITWGVQCANTANNKTSAIVFGGTTVASRAGVADANLGRTHQALITRRGAAVQVSTGWSDTQGGATLVSHTAPAEVLANDITIAFRVQGGAAGDLVNRQVQILKGSRPASFTV